MRLLDTMVDFLAYWRRYSGLDLGEMFDGWLREYMARYPELLIKQVGCWGGLDELRKTIMEKVLPKLDDLIHGIIEAWMNVREVAEEVCLRGEETLNIRLNPYIVLYVGSGCGAGWATTLLERPAILLGLENIADLGWIYRERIRGLIAHELGHLYHMKVRGEWMEFEKMEENPYFQLYSEGFAQYCEHLILGRESWHVAIGRNWLKECKRRSQDLAARYLEDSMKMDVRRFFGSWFDIDGIRHAGYFLGHEMISWLKEKFGLTIKEIATLPRGEVEESVKNFLSRLSGRRIVSRDL